jgi:triacylglycerol lipase
MYSQPVRKRNPDDSVSDRVITDEYAMVRDFYELPKHPMVFAHGLMGFDELHLVGNVLPGLKYWRGIVDELRSRGVEVITAAVPPSGAIENRAAMLGERIAKKANGKSVNIIAHSMVRALWLRMRTRTDDV